MKEQEDFDNWKLQRDRKEYEDEMIWRNHLAQRNKEYEEKIRNKEIDNLLNRL